MYRFVLIAAYFILALSELSIVSANENLKPQTRPNILFIYTDDHSWRTLGCYKEDGAWPWVNTPNIDRLAAEGVRFTHAYGAAWCTPSRAAFLTGLLPHGIKGLKITSTYEGTYDPAVCRFWPAELRRSGYHNAVIGKWHVTRDVGHGRDWDHSVVWHQGDYQGDIYNDQPVSTDGSPKTTLHGYSTDHYTDLAVDYIKRPHRQPWFLWLCYNAPHPPNTVAPRHKQRYADAEVSVPVDIFGPRPGKPQHLREMNAWHRGINSGDPTFDLFYAADEQKRLVTRRQSLTEIVRDYNRLVCALDEAVGRLLDSLKETGQLENTLIVFTADQGFAWGEHGLVGKGWPYEACMRMPMIVRPPSKSGEMARGRVCRHAVGLVDLPPTLLAMAGTPLPWEMHGHDLTPLLINPESDWPHPVLLEHFFWHFGDETEPGKSRTRNVTWWLSLRRGKYKYIRTLVENEMEEVYDLVQDPNELINLALEKGHAGELRRLRGELVAELKRTNTKFVGNLPRPLTAD